MESKFDSKKERRLCYAAAILTALVSNPNNTHTIKGLIPSAIEAADKLIEDCYKDNNHASV